MCCTVRSDNIQQSATPPQKHATGERQAGPLCTGGKSHASQVTHKARVRTGWANLPSARVGNPLRAIPKVATNAGCNGEGFAGPGRRPYKNDRQHYKLRNSEEKHLRLDQGEEQSGRASCQMEGGDWKNCAYDIHQIPLNTPQVAGCEQTTLRDCLLQSEEIAKTSYYDIREKGVRVVLKSGTHWGGCADYGAFPLRNHRFAR